MKRLSTSVGTALAGLLALALTACGGGGAGESTAADESGATPSGQDTSAAPDQGGGESYRIGWVVQNADNPAQVALVEAGQAEAQAMANVEVVAEYSTSLEDQISKTETLVAQGVDALGLLPWEGGAILPTVQQAHDAGVAVFFTQDTAPGAVEQGIAVTYIAADEVEGGRLVGEWLVEELGGTGEVALVEGAPGDSATVDRTQGFLEAIEGSDLELVAQDTANWVRDEGLRVATDILTAHPNLNAIFAHNDEMAFGVLEAMRAAGKEDQITLVGYNGTCIGLEATIKGDFDAEGILYTADIGKEFIRSAVAHLSGEQVEPRITTPVVAMDTEQMNAILDGSEQGDPGLVERLEAASAGDC